MWCSGGCGGGDKNDKSKNNEYGEAKKYEDFLIKNQAWNEKKTDSKEKDQRSYLTKKK